MFLKKLFWRMALLSCVCLGAGCGHLPSGMRLSSHANSIGMEFVLIPAGSFIMGSDHRDGDRDEEPSHHVTITRPFYLGKYEVTQAQWTAVMGENPSYFQGMPNRPVEQVSWNDVQEFIQSLNQKEGHTRYRLPTEAEWEYAARAGSKGDYSFGNNAKHLRQYAWVGIYIGWDDEGSNRVTYDGNADRTTHPVGQKLSNAWGLHDVHGNVSEWVEDRYSANYYRGSPAADPKGSLKSPHRVVRGCDWGNFNTWSCRLAKRNMGLPDELDWRLGFRLAISVE